MTTPGESSTAATGKRMLIRADGDPRIGAGHLMRCLALAQAWQDAGGTARFALAAGLDTMRSLLRAEGMEAEEVPGPIGAAADAAATAKLARDSGADWVVMDGYRFGGEFQRSMRQAGALTAVIDDNGECAPHQADLIVNQNIHATAEMYRDRRTPSTLLLGTRYVMLRRPFRQRRSLTARIAPPQGARLLLTLGGADPENVTLKAVEALPDAEVPGLQAVALVGALNPHRPVLEAAVADSPVPIQLRRNEPDMPGLMATVDLAVAAAGSTVWELLYSGVPTIVLAIADNQRGVAAELEAAQAALNLGWHSEVSRRALALAVRRLALSQPQREEMIARGRALVDGEGASRIVEALLAGAAARQPRRR